MKKIVYLLLALGIVFQSRADEFAITNLTITGNGVSLSWGPVGNQSPLGSPTDRWIVEKFDLASNQTSFIGNVVSNASAMVVPDGNDCAFYKIRKVNILPFPDDNFRRVVAAAIWPKLNPTNEIYDIDNLASVTFISTYNYVADATGLRYLPALGILCFVARYGTIANLDLSYNTNLTWFASADTFLPNGIDLSHNVNLRILCLAGCGLTNLDVSHNTDLRQLDCQANSLTSLDISANTNLNGVDLRGNPITNVMVWWPNPSRTNIPMGVSFAGINSDYYPGRDHYLDNLTFSSP